MMQRDKGKPNDRMPHYHRPFLRRSPRVKRPQAAALDRVRCVGRTRAFVGC